MASASSIMSFIGAVGLANVFGFFSAVIVFAVIYAVLAWFFAQRQHWAWITLTILSFNPRRMDHQFSLSSEALGRGLRRHANHL